MLKRIITSALFLLIMGNLRSQDHHFSMYDASPLFLNPSMTGLFEGDWRVHGQYRTQWNAVNFKPYTTGLISFDMPYKKWGFGAQIINSRAGAGNLNALQGTLSAAYTIPIDAPKYHNVSFGLQLGFTQKTLEYQLLTFDNQYTTRNGGGFDNGISSEESFVGQSVYQPNLNGGMMYYYGKQQSKINPFVGFSVFNLLQPEESLLTGNNNDLPIRIYGHIGTRVNLTELIYILPKVLIMQQREFQEQTFAIDGGFYFKKAEAHLLAGLIYRNKDAAIPSFGFKKQNYILRLSYDFNTSSLSDFSKSRGGFEISFTYMKQKKTSHKKICPRL